jgi:hypothetical protein
MAQASAVSAQQAAGARAAAASVAELGSLAERLQDSIAEFSVRGPGCRGASAGQTRAAREGPSYVPHTAGAARGARLAGRGDYSARKCSRVALSGW